MKERSSSVNGMLIFLIYGMFALFSLFLVVIGAKVYRQVTAAGRENTEIRSAFSYVANKVRMGGGSGEEICLEKRDGVTVLVLRERVDGAQYETLLYFYDGALREYFAAAGQDFTPGAGERIARAENAWFEETRAGALRLTLEDSQGGRRSMRLSVPPRDQE